MPYIDIGDAQLWVEDDDGDATPLVLLHAAAGHSGAWMEQRPLFAAAGYRVITYDLRGFGKSQGVAGAESTGSKVADLEALSAKLALPPFCLVGTAYGGFGALEFALDNPDKLRALVVSTSFGGLTDPEFTAMRAKHIRPDLADMPTVEKELGDSYRAANPEGVKHFEEMEHGSFGSPRQRLRTPTTLKRLESMRVPTLIIAGSEDVYAPPPVMQAFAERIPGARFEVIDGAGHSAYWEQPEVWNQIVTRFLNEHR